MEYEQIHPRVCKGQRLLFKQLRAYPVGEFVRLESASRSGNSSISILEFWDWLGESPRFSELGLNCQVGWPRVRVN